MVTIAWKGKLIFEAETPSGNKLTFDSNSGEEVSQGPSPMETLLAAVGACTAMDVISILEKKRQDVTGYRIEVEGERKPPGEWPRPYDRITLRHIVIGNDIDPVAVARAIELSDDKYCSVMATLKQTPRLVSEWKIEAPSNA